MLVLAVSVAVILLHVTSPGSIATVYHMASYRDKLQVETLLKPISSCLLMLLWPKQATCMSQQNECGMGLRRAED
jgi:hypothetical protein